jgi:hypothetical protein
MLIECALGRLQDSIGRFIIPSAALSDVQALKAQIELRRSALRDIEIIRTRLRLSRTRATTGLARRKKASHRTSGRNPGSALRNRLIAQLV